MTVDSNEPTISIIIPVHNGGDHFRMCLLSLTESLTAPEEIIVVADGESDGSWRFAEDFETKLIRLPTAKGPASARNVGAREAKGDILFFIDADVTIAKDSIDKVITHFTNDPDLAAVFGSYDDKPYETNFLSQYKNLFHHYVHQISKEQASTFWGACGAIRREIFLDKGGFNENYRLPSIEDIELGYRLKKAGYKIRLIKSLNVKHLKHWGVLSLLKADFFYRALPWTRLILRQGDFLDDLNIKISNRISVISVFFLLITLIGTFTIPWLLVPDFLLVILILTINYGLFRFFKIKRGICFAIKTIPMVLLYYFYCGLAFLLGYTDHLINKLGK